MTPSLSFRVFLGVLWLALPAPALAKTVATCFSPAGHCDQVLIHWIKASLHTLDGAIYGLTDDEIADAFIAAHRRGVTIRLVVDQTQSKGKHSVSQKLLRAGIPLRIRRGTRGGIQHNKFLVIDKKYVITGSFNWTRNAANKNDENFVVLDDQASLFTKEFQRLWEALPKVKKSKRKVTP